MRTDEQREVYNAERRTVCPECGSEDLFADYERAEVICNNCNLSIIRRPIAVDINKERIKANPERNETYLNIPAPGKSI